LRAANLSFFAIFNGRFCSAIVPPFPATAPRSVSSAEREQVATKSQGSPENAWSDDLADEFL
jgi:hypothetical protein